MMHEFTAWRNGGNTHCLGYRQAWCLVPVRQRHCLLELTPEVTTAVQCLDAHLLDFQFDCFHFGLGLEESCLLALSSY